MEPGPGSAKGPVLRGTSAKWRKLTIAMARKMRGEVPHGGLRGSQWSRLNFPTDKEVNEAEARGMPAHLNLQLR
jgi:hypothetical protein